MRVGRTAPPGASARGGPDFRAFRTRFGPVVLGSPAADPASFRAGARARDESGAIGSRRRAEHSGTTDAADHRAALGRDRSAGGAAAGRLDRRPGRAVAYRALRQGHAVNNNGLVWRVFADKPDDNGTFKLIRERSATQHRAAPGNYVVHVALGLVSAVRSVS
jgi:hypothetical protein